MDKQVITRIICVLIGAAVALTLHVYGVKLYFAVPFGVGAWLIATIGLSLALGLDRLPKQ
ncbi:MAG TPA: hypothetical protein VHD14_09455 [Pseudolabrys sp.]|nr:hypothetical protein [Pseudolabrys sp.]